MDKQNPKVVVVGSFNMDLVVKAGRRPQTGETLMGEEFGMFIGGKGSNQAIAAARLGTDVTMIGRLGADLFGDTLMAAHAEEGICTDYVIRDTEVGTGVASILVDADGDNSIVLVPQANMRLTVADVEQASESIAAADALLLQLEVPIAVSQRAAEIAKSNDATVVLNPAPAQELPDDFLAQVDILTPNEVETESLSGVRVSTATDAERAAKVLLDKGLSAVILTLGERGALLLTPDLTQQVPAYSVEVVDTTAAGDAFCGALATGLARGENLVDAVAFANAAGALAVTVLGAAPSMPTAAQVEAFRGGHNEARRLRLLKSNFSGWIIRRSYMNGAHWLVKTLQQRGVEYVFALCGNGLKPFLDACVDLGMPVIDVRNEQSARIHGRYMGADDQTDWGGRCECGTGTHEHSHRTRQRLLGWRTDAPDQRLCHHGYTRYGTFPRTGSGGYGGTRL